MQITFENGRILITPRAEADLERVERKLAWLQSTNLKAIKRKNTRIRELEKTVCRMAGLLVNGPIVKGIEMRASKERNGALDAMLDDIIKDLSCGQTKEYVAKMRRKIKAYGDARA